MISELVFEEFLMENLDLIEEGLTLVHRQLKIVGEGKGTPLLILHGGPGSRSCAMIPGYSLMKSERPIIFYDQLGSGNSDRPTDLSLWNIERFVNEIDYLREDLDLKELHILGWNHLKMLSKPIDQTQTTITTLSFSNIV